MMSPVTKPPLNQKGRIGFGVFRLIRRVSGPVTSIDSKFWARDANRPPAEA